MKPGIYKLFGNAVEYDGDTAFDLDSREFIPVELLEEMGEYYGEVS